jgi:TolB-like protein
MRGFIEELRYRNVFRVAIAYAVIGWLVAQVSDLVVDAFNLPDRFMQMVIILLVLGFPLAVFLAWAFELTPEGVKKARDLPADLPKDPRSGRRLNTVIMATLIVAVAWLGWDKLQGPDTESVVTDKSIAVLPFADFSPDADHAWFADGLTDEILNALARTRDLRVASRTSSFAYRNSDKDMPAIAAELDVAHILEGSVRRAGDRIRVTAQLIRASDDAHLWSETFDASSDDSIEIQETIAFEIASLLDTAMDPEELRRMVAAGTSSIAAWESYIRMRELYLRSIEEFSSTSGNEQTLALYEETIAEDPEFAEAHLAMAEVLYGWLSPSSVTGPPAGVSMDALRELFADAADSAARYARDDDTRLGAEALRARVQLRLPDLVELTRKRLEFQPDDREVWSLHFEALLLASRFDDAREFVRRVMDHDFGNEDQLATIVAYVARIDLQAGLAGVEKMLATPSPSPADLYQAHRIYLYADRLAEAAAVGQRYLNNASDPRWSVMVKIRQACAEDRVADAERLYAEYDFSGVNITNNNIHWLALKTLGRDAEAVALIRPLDQPETLGALATLLTYTHFDPRPFPNLSKLLAAQGVQRNNPTQINFACKRQEE